LRSILFLIAGASGSRNGFLPLFKVDNCFFSAPKLVVSLIELTKSSNFRSPSLFETLNSDSATLSEVSLVGIVFRFFIGVKSFG